KRYKAKNIRRAPVKLSRRLNMHAATTSAKKNSFRSAPRIVSGRFSDRNTGLRCMIIRLKQVSDAKEPEKEIHRQDSHAEAKQEPGKGALSAAFPEGEREAADNNSDQGE